MTLPELLRNQYTLELTTPHLTEKKVSSIDIIYGIEYFLTSLGKEKKDMYKILGMPSLPNLIPNAFCCRFYGAHSENTLV